MKHFVISIIASLAHCTIVQQPLPYALDALEPVISSKLLDVHFNGHHKKYVDTLNKLLDQKPAFNLDVTKQIKFNSGGHFNHEFFWQSMASPKTNQTPGPNTLRLINKSFGSLDKLMARFNEAAVAVEGSGWCWLALSPDSDSL